MIGKKLKELLKLRKMKQIELANHVNISPSRLSNYLSDKREPDLEILAKMAQYLGTDLNYFTKIKFDVNRDSAYMQADNVEGSLEEDTQSSAYAADGSSEFVYVPQLPINSKKRASKSNVVAVSKMFMEGVKDPAENVTLFEVTTGIGGNVYKTGDHLLAAKAGSVKLTNGTILVETGRNGKSYRYHDQGDRSVLFDMEENYLIPVSDKNIDGLHAVVWIFHKS
ncbi:MAG: helix-turn-helix domain-containing protein [Deferribacteraceae bacterium]|jgi:transcriptional regulator with XRE-family HTH domain|nr:helix-turn-helix domain-containing protein [Deferribacteraceae bacterium]